MNNVNSKRKVTRIFVILLPILIIGFIVAELRYSDNFNAKKYKVVGPSNEGNVQMHFSDREDSTSVWLKTDFDFYGTTVDLKAQTIDGTLTNNSGYEIEKWQMRINFNDECFFNNAWCGKVEIHQNVLTDERIQTLDLRNYNLDDIKLEYLYDGDLLIHLNKGDYVIYYPSAHDNEMPVVNKTQLTMGFIIYYLDFPDLTDYELTYNLHRVFTDDHVSLIAILLGIIWIAILVVHIAFTAMHVATVKEMELKKSGILSMSDIYTVIYAINLQKDELTPIVTDKQFEEIRDRNLSAYKQLKSILENDCDEAYMNVMLECCDYERIRKRLKDKNTWAVEYVSKSYGWCRVRIFAMEKDINDKVNSILLTVQIINDEKAEAEANERRVAEAEHESKAKSNFLANMSHEIRTPINTVIGFDTMILRESKDPVIKAYAKNIKSAANMLLSLINGILDMSKVEADKMELVMGEYSFKQLMIEVVNMVKTRAEFDRLEFICDVSPDIADKLYGDAVRLKQVIINLITNAAKYTDKGSVTLYVYGKKHDGKMHILISVKDTGIGLKEEDLKKITERFSRFDSKRNHTVEGTGIGLNLVSGILDLMDSKLHIISKYGEGSEFYFEIEQEIIEDTTIGEIDFTEDISEDEEYQALFKAPDAKVLVVDDNAMNLKVFEDLLKETELQIDTAGSGKIALEKTDEKVYDLIFMDHMMPEMDGIETFQHIRENEAGPNINTPVIILTANAVKGAKEEYERLGFDAFLAKPIQPDVLEKTVLKYLDASKVKENTEPKRKKSDDVELPVIIGVDTAYGLNHTGGISSYMPVLNQFMAVAESDLAELESYAEEIRKDNSNKDAIASYRIKVHAMKANANIMGALQVFGVAATLEKLASKEDVSGILALEPYFCELWTELKDNVTESMPESEEKKEIKNKEQVEPLIHLLETSIKAYDIKSSDDMLKKLKEFSWEGHSLELIKQLEIAVANLDAEQVVAICNELRG